MGNGASVLRAAVNTEIIYTEQSTNNRGFILTEQVNQVTTTITDKIVATGMMMSNVVDTTTITVTEALIIKTLHLREICIPGFKLPGNEILTATATLHYLSDYNAEESRELLKFVKDFNFSTHAIKDLVADKLQKDDAKQIFTEIQHIFTNLAIPKEHQMLPSDYLYFGNENHKINLTMFLKTNPFFVSALGTKRVNGKLYFYTNSLYVNSVDNGGEGKGEVDTWFSQLMKYDHVLHSNATFDTEMNLVSITIFAKTDDGFRHMRALSGVCRCLPAFQSRRCNATWRSRRQNKSGR